MNNWQVGFKTDITTIDTRVQNEYYKINNAKGFINPSEISILNLYRSLYFYQFFFSNKPTLTVFHQFYYLPVE